MKAARQCFSVGLLLAAAILGAAQQPAGMAPPQAPGLLAIPDGVVAQPAPSSQDVAQSQTQVSVPIRVMVGKSVLINTADPLKRVSVTDPAIADAVVIAPAQVLIQGRAPGEVSLVWLWLMRSPAPILISRSTIKGRV